MINTNTTDRLSEKRRALTAVRTDPSPAAVKDISGAMNATLADVFALYVKTKNFHWHVSGPHFRDYHLLLDEHADQPFAMTDPMAERVRKLGGQTLKSIGQISRSKRVLDNDLQYAGSGPFRSCFLEAATSVGRKNPCNTPILLYSIAPGSIATTTTKLHRKWLRQKISPVPNGPNGIA